MKSRISPIGNPRQEGFDLPSTAESRGTLLTNGANHAHNAMTVEQLPEFYLHGFSPSYEGIGTSADVSALSNGESLKQSTPLDQFEELIASDLFSPNVNLTRFVISLMWNTMTEAPYSTASCTLVMPAALCHYTLHGKIESVKTLKKKQNGEDIDVLETDGFRTLEAGGWCSIRDKNQRALFFGRVVGVKIFTQADPNTGVLSSVVNLTIASFIYPYMVSEHRRAATIEGPLKNVSRAAIHASGVRGGGASPREWESPTLEALTKFTGNAESKPSEMLSFFLNKLGHFILPPSLVGTVSDPELYTLGANLTVLNGDPTNSQNTPYSLASSRIDSIDVVQARPEPRYFVQSFLANNSTMWQIITSIFQAGSPLLEVFPVLLPIVDNDPESLPTIQKARPSLVAQAVKSPTTLTNDQGQTQAQTEAPLFDTLTPLARMLKAVPVIVYRYRPLQPDFDISGDSLGENGRLGRTRIDGKVPEAEKYFGTRDRTTDLKQREGSGYEFVEISSKYVISQNLSWDDMQRCNAVHLAAPYQAAEFADNLVFGAGVKPVFDTIDINRNGLRMHTSKTPFYDVAKKSNQDKTKLFSAASAHAERMYYTIGEGQAYASGEIVCTYLPNPLLVCGMWVKIVYGQGSRPLYGYLMSVEHEVSVAPDTGLPQGITKLAISRASYGGRVPTVKLNTDPNYRPPTPRAENRDREQVRKPVVPRQEKPLQASTGANLEATKQGNTPSGLPKELQDPARPSKITAGTPKRFTPEDPTVPAGRSVAQTTAPLPTTARATATPELVPFGVDQVAPTALVPNQYTTPIAFVQGTGYAPYRLHSEQNRVDSQNDSEGRLYPVAYRVNMFWPYSTTARYGASGNRSLANLAHMDDYYGANQQAYFTQNDTSMLPYVPRVYSFRGDSPAPATSAIQGVIRVTDYKGTPLATTGARQQVMLGTGDNFRERGWLAWFNDKQNIYRIEFHDGSISLVRPTKDPAGAAIEETSMYFFSNVANEHRYRSLAEPLRYYEYEWERVAFISAPDAQGNRTVLWQKSGVDVASIFFRGEIK